MSIFTVLTIIWTFQKIDTLRVSENDMVLGHLRLKKRTP